MWCRSPLSTHSSLLITACQHNKGLHVLLPDHPPEIFDCGGQRTLSCNKLLPGVVTLTDQKQQPPHGINLLKILNIETV